MPDSVPAALRERATTRSVLGWLVVVAFLYAVLGSSPLQLATSLVTGAVVGLAGLLTEVYDLRSEVESLGVGLVALLGGSALTLLDGGPASAGVSMLLVGGWLSLDAVQVLRHDGVREPTAERDGHDVYRAYVTRRVHETIRDEPQTPRELRESLEADADVVDEAVDALERRGTVVAAGSELRVADDEEAAENGSLARTRSTVAGWVRRLLRPVTMEFETDPTETGRVS